MEDQMASTEARERVLDAAERLFAKRGYAAVTLRDIAAEVGIRHTSLYHHVPGGKEELFVEVTRRNLQRHRQGLTQAIAQAEPNVRSQLYAAAEWLLSQSPMDLIRFTYSDLPSIDPVHAHHLSKMTFESMILPILAVLEQAQQRGEIEHHNPGLIAGGLLGMIESLHAVPDASVERSRKIMAFTLIDAFLDGLRKR